MKNSINEIYITKEEQAKILLASYELIEAECSRLKRELLEQIRLIPAGPPGPPGTERTVIVEARGAQGNTGVGVVEARLNDDNLVIELTDGSTYDVGNVKGGPRGLIGPIGDSGPSGPAGPRGVPGVIGPTGLIGPRGVQGDQGFPGVQGEKGDKGDRGSLGTTGPKGERGLRGDRGDRGDVGPAGQTGQSAPVVDVGAIVKDLEKKFGNLQTQINRQVANLKNLGGGGSAGSGSYSILDQSDVVHAQLATLTQNDLLVFDSALNKFHALNISSISTIVALQAAVDALGGSVAYTKLIDVANSTFTYIGEAVAGSSNGAIVWRIQLVDTTNDPDTDIVWANSQTTFVNEWDNRATYTYG